MGLDSYLELYTTLYGWFFSGIIWSVLSATGIIFLPFLVTLIQVWREGHEMGEDSDGVAWMIRRMEVELISAVVVFGLCLVPSNITSLSHLSLYYQPPATSINPTPTTATVTNSDSSYADADAFGNSVPSNAAVPPWWYTVMGLSSGINAAVRAGIQADIRDFRQLEDLARIATIQDPQLRLQIQRFYSECFVPARSRYLRAGSPSAQAAAEIATYGEADPDWIGSHAFQSDPMLYPDIYATSDVPGFVFNSNRDADADPQAAAPALGRPSCVDWWTAQNVGLRDLMVSSVSTSNSLWTKVKAVFTALSDAELKDQLAKMAYDKTAPSYVDSESGSNGIGNEQSTFSSLMHMPANLAGAAGLGWEAFKASASMKPLIYFMTMAQPLILMGIYMFMPMILVFGRYHLSIMLLGALAIFTVKFWTVMWFVARWMDDHLIAAMFPGMNGAALMQFITDGSSTENISKRIVLNILLMFMYIGLPMLFSGMMAWIGVHIGHGIQKMYSDAVNSGVSSGATGAGMAGKLAGKGR
ncbi:MAG: conjugal transfer protein TraG [Burkholderiales bacterium]|nr:MAG: conjugal transfer protein TraG [Burkholderiales bacterium]